MFKPSIATVSLATAVLLSLGSPLSAQSPNLQLAAQQVLQSPAPTLKGTSMSVEQQLAALQQQVNSLQAQVAALMSVLKVNANGATLQAPSILIIGNDGVTIQSQKNIALGAGQHLAAQASGNAALQAGASASVQSASTLDLKGSVIKLNGGTKPLATVGSQVQVPKQAIGQVTTGSANVLGN